MDCWWGVGMAQSYSWLWAALVCLVFFFFLWRWSLTLKQNTWRTQASYPAWWWVLKKCIYNFFFFLEVFSSSFKITTLGKCLAAALVVCCCIFQRQLDVCPLLHLHCGCLTGVRKWALLTELRLFGLEVCLTITTLFRGIIRGGGERTVLSEDSLFLFRTQSLTGPLKSRNPLLPDSCCLRMEWRAGNTTAAFVLPAPLCVKRCEAWCSLITNS